MAFSFIDDLTLSDEAFRATGTDLDELFASSWLAVLHLLIGNPEALRPEQTEHIELGNTSIDLLLFDFLERQLYIKDTLGAFLRPDSVTVTAADGRYSVRSDLRGEAFDPHRHVAGTEVKAITMYRLEVKKSDGLWTATVVVDV